MDDPDADLNRVHVEQLASGAVFIVGAIAWLLSARSWFGAALLVGVYLALYFGIRAWRLRRGR